jgi:uncharacterized protein (DUF302 family)
MNKYYYKKRLNIDFSSAIAKAKEELKKEGFGILTEIDVKSTLKKKLNINYKNYIILGACNPPFAYKALEAETDIGLLLPCNVIIYEENSKTYISAILPTVAMSFVDNQELKNIAEQIELKLKKAIDNL